MPHLPLQFLFTLRPLALAVKPVSDKVIGFPTASGFNFDKTLPKIFLGIFLKKDHAIFIRFNTGKGMLDTGRQFWHLEGKIRDFRPESTCFVVPIFLYILYNILDELILFCQKEGVLQEPFLSIS